MIAAAALCAWGTLCLLFWQGSWQLLYHPTAAVTRTPASVGLHYDSVDFAATPSGATLLHGWWVPGNPGSRFTAIYLHGASGNLGDSVDALIPLHSVGLNIFDFDYRGYGQSRFEHPSEARWHEDADSAIGYLVNTRHIPPDSIVLVGEGLGANLALEVAAAHPELAGLVVDEPLQAPVDAIFNDSRAKLVPARLLVRDRWDSKLAATTLRISSLWFCRTSPPGQLGVPENPAAFDNVTAPKMLVWLTDTTHTERDIEESLKRWLDDLPRERQVGPGQVILK
jgi:pimeloyl-ACP methyl ester carboxylesterase